MQDDVVALGHTRLISLLRGGASLAQEPEEALEALDAVRRAGIVLDVPRTEVFAAASKSFWLSALSSKSTPASCFVSDSPRRPPPGRSQQ